MPRPRCDGRTPPHSPIVKPPLEGELGTVMIPKATITSPVEDRERVEARGRGSGCSSSSAKSSGV